MPAHIQERVTLPAFNDPVLITSFTTPSKGGATTSWALGNLMAQWDAKPVAELEADDCYHFSQIRPQMHRINGSVEIEWPSNVVYAANPKGADRTILFLVGVEPTLNWKDFAEAVAHFALRAGVRTAISMRAVPSSVNHREESQVFAWYSRPEQQSVFGLPALDLEEGAADMGIVINSCLKAMGCETVDLFALEPLYIPAMPYAKAGGAILEAIGRAFHAEIDRSQLTAVIRQQDEAMDGLVAVSPELQRGLEAMSQQRNLLMKAAKGSSQALPSTNGTGLEEKLLDTDDVLRDVEEFFRSSQ